MSEYYRLESQKSQIGVILDTDTRNNTERCAYILEDEKCRVLNSVINTSLQDECSINQSYSAHIQNIDPYLVTYIQGVWELLYEHARPKNQNIRHYDCAFFFTDKTAAESYRRYNGMEDATLCEVEIIEEYSSFLGDMQWLEMIDEKKATASECIDAFKHYWNGEMTDNPIEEVLFLGKYKLHPISAN